ncbi:MAG: type II toxin-antitoxin system prevent-host-death family antitoxin [Deltaproteobacteria bacterium]|nr:type II toxin-antitoxin system prevent-host-death family antitoxin [Deltaproteobacteria bacterium]
MVKWQVNEAKAKFSELIKKGQEGPQIIVSRNKEVGVLISFEEFQEFQKYKVQLKKPSLLEFVDSLRDVRETQTDIRIPPRKNRKTAARIHDCTLVTRNEKDFLGTKIAILNPFYCS